MRIDLKLNVEPKENLLNRGCNSPQTACGKAIIAGEHAVVYGAKAIAMPLSQLRMKINLNQAENCAHDSGLEVKLGDTPVANIIYDVIKDAFELLGLKETSLKIDGYSKVPIGAGLGSSASLCVALLKSLACRFKINLSIRDLSLLGNQLEARFHGNPSGLDTAVVAYEKCIVFAKNVKDNSAMIDPLDIPNNKWRFALIDSGVRASTYTMVQNAKPFFMGSSGDQLLYKFNELTESIISGMTKLDIPLVSHSINETCKYLDKIGVVTDRLWDIIHTCQSLGIKAAKPTGAGGGGAILALLDAGNYNEQLVKLKNAFGSKNVYDASL